MDTELMATMSASLTSLNAGAIDITKTVLPLAIPVMIAFALVYKGISFFRGVAHV